MKTRHVALLASTLAGALAFAGTAYAQTPIRIRGTITALEGNVLSVKARDGRDLKLELDDKLVVATAKAIKLEDLKAGDYVGTTAMKRGDQMVAVEVHTLAPTVPQGHTPWDLQPESTMTNALVGTITKMGDANELTLNYKDGMQKIMVPNGIPIVTTIPADRSALRAGEYIFAAAQSFPDGKITAARIQVSKDGVRPPQ